MFLFVLLKIILHFGCFKEEIEENLMSIKDNMENEMIDSDKLKGCFRMLILTDLSDDHYSISLILGKYFHAYPKEHFLNHFIFVYVIQALNYSVLNYSAFH